MFIFDAQRIFVGSMNFDQRSMHLNTEIGLLIDSTELAAELKRRFDAMVQPANAYQLLLRPNPSGEGQQLVWRTFENDQMVEFQDEPSRSTGQVIQVELLSILPLDDDL
jgi:putative cardiolipin synthase